jgi:hypothetical protein
MELDSICSSLIKHFRSVRKRLDDLLDLFDGHGSRLVEDHAHPRRRLNVRRRFGVRVDCVGSLTTTMSELADDDRAPSLRSGDDRLECRDSVPWRPLVDDRVLRGLEMGTVDRDVALNDVK